jgi:ubiquinone/menaquinone biosynthesis C-methylase UbiE
MNESNRYTTTTIDRSEVDPCFLFLVNRSQNAKNKLRGTAVVSTGIDTEVFQEFEHASWRRVVERYHDSWGRLTRQTIKPLLEVLGVGQNTAIVDVATGPGYVAAEASARGANAIGVDFSPEMVNKAREIHPQVQFLEGDALDLPFEDCSFDAACMNFGILHLAQPEDGVRELTRIVRPGGRVAFTAWAPPGEAPGYQAILGALDAYGTPSDIPVGPDFFRFGRREECLATCARVGIRSPGVRIISPMYWEMPTAAAFFSAFLGGSVRIGGLLRDQSPQALNAIESSVATSLEAFRVDGKEYRIPMSAVLTWGIR